MKTSLLRRVECFQSTSTAMAKVMIFSFTLFLCLAYFSNNLRFDSRPYGDCIRTAIQSSAQIFSAEKIADNAEKPTDLSHIVFGIAASEKLWSRRKSYIKLWWRPDQMRGVVWLDKAVRTSKDDEKTLPPVKVSASTAKFRYRHSGGHRSALRISRIVSETLRLGVGGARWIVMGDDDTVFVPENLISVLRKYDHNQFYYVGASSESHVQNINFSYGMAYGGGGFAISVPLARQLAKMQDQCMERYTGLYGSDDRIHACMAELGVPLTKEPGFHQFDLYGSVFGLLAAHPVAPLVSLHHLDIVQPIFPNADRVKSLKKLQGPMALDSAALIQQSICYDPTHKWTVSVSWGYAVQIFRGIFTARDMEIPGRTFLNWYPRSDYTGYSFNTRPFSRNVCQRPFVYYVSKARFDPKSNRTVSEYERHRDVNTACNWKMEDPSQIKRVEVLKKPDPNMWAKAPRRNCCRVLPTEKKGTMVIDVGACNEDEVVAFKTTDSKTKINVA